MLYDAPRFLDAGETALTVEFGDSVDPAINARVLALDAALREAPMEGALETAPTYRSLTIHYEPLALSRAKLVAHVAAQLAGLRPADAIAPRTRWIVPCCYAPIFAEDIGEAAGLLDLSIETLATRHAGGDYRAYMCGFAPGWTYLGGLPAALALPRRAAPRGETPPGAVLVGGALALIGAQPMPTGWYVVGRTPEKLFAPRRDPPFLIAPGDAVRFEPIGGAEFAVLETRAAAGEIVARREAVP